MANWQWFGRLHTRVYRATDGRIGGNLIGLPMLLLTTTGRRSGQPRTSPLPYMQDERSLVIVGSYGGAPVDPAWWLNLQSEPRARVQIGAEEQAVVAHLAVGAERERLWPAAKKFNRNYVRYEKKTAREIPVVVLTPLD